MSSQFQFFPGVVTVCWNLEITLCRAKQGKTHRVDDVFLNVDCTKAYHVPQNKRFEESHLFLCT
jgi:hypothetical protein